MERKSLYDISWQVSEEEYRADPAYSYSILSKFNREGFSNIDKLFDKVESPSLTFGSMVDTLITDGQEEFDRRFIVAEVPTIRDSLRQRARYLYETFKDTYRNIDDIPESAISQVGIDYDYYANPKYNSYRVKKIKEECSEYYNLLFLSQDKTLVSNTDYNDALACVEALKTSKYTKFYFDVNTPFDTDIERFYQLKFKGEYEGIKLRCMADELVINHLEKTIIPVDLKTSSKREYDFHKSFIEWNYFIQSQLYWYIIRQNLDKDPFYKDYKLLDYRFIVINKFSLTPLVWNYPDTQCVCDLTYGPNNRYKCRNWRNIVKELDYYLNTKPELPIGISDINDLKLFLNKE